MAPKPPSRPSSDVVYDKRAELVRDLMTKESAYQDAKTARLKALRLEKEAAEPPPPAKPASKARKKKA